MISAWLLLAAACLAPACAVSKTAEAATEQELEAAVDGGTAHITITRDISTTRGYVLDNVGIKSLRGACHQEEPGADWCKLKLGETIQIQNDLWLDSLQLIPPGSGKPALAIPQLNSRVWLTNVTIKSEGSPGAQGIELSGKLFAENCTFSQLQSQERAPGAAVSLIADAATATLHKCTLSANNVLDNPRGAAVVHLGAAGGLLFTESVFSDCRDAADSVGDRPDLRNALDPCIAANESVAAINATGHSVNPGSGAADAEVYLQPGRPLQFAVIGSDGEIVKWADAMGPWSRPQGQEGRFLAGSEPAYLEVLRAERDASDRQAEDSQDTWPAPAGSGDSEVLPPQDSAGGSGGSPTLVAALVGSVIVLAIVAAATVAALVLLRRYRKRAGADDRVVDVGASSQQRSQGTGPLHSSHVMQAPCASQMMTAPSNGPSDHTYVAKTAPYATSAVLVAPGPHGSDVNSRHLQPVHMASSYASGPITGTAVNSLAGHPYISGFAAGATGPPPGVPAAYLPPVSPRTGGHSISILTAANLSLLEQSIAVDTRTNPFSQPPAVRSKLTAEQGLQDALDSIIISGRPLMGQYSLDAASSREITAKSVVQFATEVAAAARPVAVKFFVSRPNFEREEAALGTEALQGGFDREGLRIESNFDGSFRAPNGYIYPPCIVMPRGEHLRSWIMKRGPQLLEIAQLLVHVGRRLAAVHRQGWTHRNLHPKNILQRLGEPGNWMITDWSCAAKIGTFPPLVEGLRYAPPEDITAVEQGQVATKATAAADVWALGVIAYEALTKTAVFPVGTPEKDIRDCLTGRKPLPWEHLDDASRERIRALRGFKRSVLLCLERNPHRRPRSTEVVNMWQSMFDGPSTHTQSEQSSHLPAADAQAAAAFASNPEHADVSQLAHVGAVPSM